MAQRDLVSVVGGLVVGVIGAMVIGTTVFGISIFGGRDTRVTLVAAGTAGCSLGKETTVKAKDGEDLTWKIENYCLEDVVIAVGDFRKAEAPSAPNCSANGVDYPFDNGEREVTVPKAEARGNGKITPGKMSIKLKVKKHADPGEGMISYYFNMCLNGAPTDPLLLVER